MSIVAYNGDCLNIMKALPDKSVDLFICDLPYGCLTGGGGKEAAKRAAKGGANIIAGCVWDVKINLAAFWEQVERLMKSDSTPIIMFCTIRFGMELYASKPEWFREDLVWEKANAVGFLHANKKPLRAHENIFIFSKKNANFNNIPVKVPGAKAQKGRGKTANYLTLEGVEPTGESKEGERCMRSVIKFGGAKGVGKHPTEKPYDMYKFLIERYSNKGDTVLDPTAGSFNAVEAAFDLDRHGIGIEMNKTFYDRAVDRLDLHDL